VRVCIFRLTNTESRVYVIFLFQILEASEVVRKGSTHGKLKPTDLTFTLKIANKLLGTKVYQVIHNTTQHNTLLISQFNHFSLLSSYVFFRI
jgi:hypothetical protein